MWRSTILSTEMMNQSWATDNIFVNIGFIYQSKLSDMRICLFSWFDIIVYFIFLGFGWLISQNKQYEDVSWASEKVWSAVSLERKTKNTDYAESVSRHRIVYKIYQRVLSHQGRWGQPESPAGSLETSCSRTDPRTRPCPRPGCNLQRRAPAPPPAARPCGRQCGPGWTALWEKWISNTALLEDQP